MPELRLLTDTNISAPAVRALRNAGHDVLYSAERAADPGDGALLKEAQYEGRVLITKDRDMGAHVFRDDLRHAGVLLIDDLGDAAQENANPYESIPQRCAWMVNSIEQANRRGKTGASGDNSPIRCSL